MADGEAAPPLDPPPTAAAAAVKSVMATTNAVMCRGFVATCVVVAALSVLVGAGYDTGAGAPIAHALVIAFLLVPLTTLLLVLRLERRLLALIEGEFPTVRIHGPEPPRARGRREGSWLWPHSSADLRTLLDDCDAGRAPAAAATAAKGPYV
ncbi:hypothetical protein ACP4OV_005497 [Aristida adscensionis]